MFEVSPVSVNAVFVILAVVVADIVAALRAVNTSVARVNVEELTKHDKVAPSAAVPETFHATVTLDNVIN